MIPIQNITEEVTLIPVYAGGKRKIVEHEILIVNDTKDYGYSYFSPFSPYGKYRGIQMEEDKLDSLDLDNVRLVVFTGGSDVNPALYNEPRNPKTYCSERRDYYEIQVFEKARERKIPCFGICRGSQLLCVLSGGKMNQHVQNHSLSHPIITHDGRTFRANSSHHQVMLPNFKTSKLLAWAKEPNNKVEAEAVSFPSINAAGVQYHPEAMNESDEAFWYARGLVENLLGV